MRQLTRLFSLFIIAHLVGCATPTILTKSEAYPKMYQQDTNSILVVPAINRSTAADAPELYSTTIAQPLAEAGYYVMPIPMIEMMLAVEGVVDGEQLKGVEPAKFKTMFGADAVLFVTINQWDTNYYVTGGNVTVGADFELISTSTNESLWNYKNVVVINTSGNSGNLLADIISTAISTAITDYVPIARQVNYSVVTTLPVGKYHSRHSLDGQDKVVNETLASKNTVN
ncbi:DUF799 family lipoprotein [Aliiglaciecola sp. 2_MG-2023]|uniref:GNA1162 family protein n=1 Tax=Alteromonadaceae TaxID=72275 RepID=UPI0026E42861|nr:MULTISPECIES: GNA1162 family protein [unclassified Aliiglaciecola]MDO6712646.1 DUF799 family lipoprotein [Aliiglaciecola sp. 2_MG-2023]MDO6753746.1 DUF799 family lipoprotein [Aliiglaciecola sp. 1_MG-2023]